MLKKDHSRALTLSELPEKVNSRLSELADDLHAEDARAGEATFFGCALLHAAALPSVYSQVIWTLTALGLVVIELFALLAMAINTAYPRCVYDEDCPMGTVCVFLRRHSESTYESQSLCIDCATLDASRERPPSFRFAQLVKYLLVDIDKYVEMTFTTAHWNDRWGGSNSAQEYCSAYAVDTGVLAWTNNTNTDFHKCMYVQESLASFGLLDVMVMTVAFLLVSVSVAADRQQQLFTRHIRLSVLPPPWRSLRSLCFKLVELLTEALLPCTVLCTILLLILSESLTATDVLLNSVAVAFILEIDDLLPSIVISTVDREVIGDFAGELGTRRSLGAIQKKGGMYGVVAFVMLMVQYSTCTQDSCENILFQCVAFTITMPFYSRISEELCAIFYEVRSGGWSAICNTDTLKHKLVQLVCEPILMTVFMMLIIKLPFELYTLNSPGLPANLAVGTANEQEAERRHRQHRPWRQ